MLGPRVETPFGHALKEYIKERPDGPTFTVDFSFVELELVNARQERLAIHREIKGDADQRLVLAKLTDANGVETRRDFFLHDPGSAQREDGFHHFLASFIGWRLPEVSTFDGREVPLYLAAIFPMLFVEQKRGWSAIQGPFPTFLKIQDISRRAMEFLLNLDVGERRRQRQEVEKRIASLEGEWAAIRQHLISRLGNLSRLQNIAATPPKEFSADSGLAIEVYLEGEWVALPIAVQYTEDQVAALEKEELATTEDAAPDLERELATRQSEVASMEAKIGDLRDSMSMAREEINENRRRISALKNDLARNQDAQKLEKFGSRLGRAVSNHTCPTCHQELDAELLPVVEVKGMAVDENIRFIRSQIELYQANAEATQDHANSIQLMYESVSSELRESLARIRELGDALRRPSASLARSAIETLVRLQARSNRYRSMQNEADGLADRFGTIAKAVSDLRASLKGLKGDDFTSLDQKKIEFFQNRLQARLQSFSFKTFKSSEILISLEDFRPIAMIPDAKTGALTVRELGFEMSASDAIRMKWSYYLALLDVGISFDTNHPGFLVFDEPDQQAIESKDVRSFLLEAAKFESRAQILVAATAEKIAEFDADLVQAGANMIRFEGYTLQRRA
jgi:predicted  nucleic acid-binding Zn-ribbon protein